MKYLKRFDNLSESVSFDIIKDILLDLTDEGFIFKIRDNKERSMVLVVLTKSDSFTYSDIGGCVNRLSGYMESEGYSIGESFADSEEFNPPGRFTYQRTLLNLKKGNIRNTNSVEITYKFSPLTLMKSKSKYSI